LMTMRPACAYSSRASASLTAFLLPLYLKIDDDTTSTRPSASSVVLLYCCFTSALLKNWCRCDQHTPLPAERPHRVRLLKGERY
jgi:hypothetical protein